MASSIFDGLNCVCGTLIPTKSSKKCVRSHLPVTAHSRPRTISAHNHYGLVIWKVVTIGAFILKALVWNKLLHRMDKT